MAINYADAGAEQFDRETASVDGLIDTTGQSTLIAKRWADPRAAGLGYWRVPDERMVRGRICLLQYGRNSGERQDRMAQADPSGQLRLGQLRRYGEYKSNYGPGEWKPWSDPFLAIVQQNGLGEFDAQQIIDLGWHRRPRRSDTDSHRQIWQKIDELIAGGLTERAAVERILPALVGVPYADVPCELCPGRHFGGLSVEAATRLKHRHDSIVHKEEVRSRETREAITLAVSAAGGQNADTQATLAAILGKLTDILVPGAPAMKRRGDGQPPTP